MDNLRNEIRDLKESMKRSLPSYVALLKGLSSLPDEFERRFWVCRVEGLLQTVKADYENFQAKTQEIDFVSKFMTLGIDMVLKARGMEPVPPQGHPRLGISLSSRGKIEPDWLDNPNREPEAIFVTYEEFVAIAQRLEGKLLQGTTVPSSEDEIPKLVYSSALELVEGDKR